MEPLIIQATRSSPFVLFDPGNQRFEVKGHSYPENAALFYKPVLDWLEEYFKTASLRCSFEFYLIYLNTSSSKFLMAILDFLEHQYLNGKQLEINWYYDKDNEIARECGDFFKEDRKLPFNLIENNDNRITL